MKRIVIIFIIFHTFKLFAQFYQGGGGPNAFFQIPASPREVAMGNTGVATSRGVFAPFWNPANTSEDWFLTDLITVDSTATDSASKGSTSRNDIKFKHLVGFIKRGAHYKNAYFGTSTYLTNNIFNCLYFGYLLKTNKDFNFGFNFIYRGIEDLWETSISQYSQEIVTERQFDFAEYLYIFNVSSTKFTGAKVPWGFNFRIVRLNYTNNESITSLGFDLGIRYPFLDSFWIFNDLNGGTVVKFEKERNSQITILTGLSGYIKKSPMPILVGLDLQSGNFSPFRVGFGGEAVYKVISFRLGLGMGRSRENFSFNMYPEKFTAGFGLSWKKKYKLDIAWSKIFAEGNEFLEFVDSPLKFSIQAEF